MLRPHSRRGQIGTISVNGVQYGTVDEMASGDGGDEGVGPQRGVPTDEHGSLGMFSNRRQAVVFLSYGQMHGLLQHDMVEEFLLVYFALLVQMHTRGTCLTSDSPSPGRGAAQRPGASRRARPAGHYRGGGRPG